MQFLKRNAQIVLLVSILLLGLLVRLQNFYIPPIDAHPMRQTDTECVAYNFSHNDSNILHPKACLIRPSTNKEGYFFLEFPLYQYGLGALYMFFGSSIVVARIYNFVLFTIALLSFYYFLLKTTNEKSALIGTFLLSFVPGSIFFIGHAIHPDVFMTTTLIMSLALYIYSLEKRNNWWIFIFSLLLLSLSVATRPFALLVVPAFLYLLWVNKSTKWQYGTLIITAPLVYGLWKLWQLQFPPEYNAWENWVLRGRDELYFFDILINRLILKNAIGEIIGKSSFIFALFGVLAGLFTKNKMATFALIWLLGVPIYWYLVPSGNITHQYYANVYLVPVIILSTIGIEWIIKNIKLNILKFSSVILILLFIAYNGLRTSSYYFDDLESANYLRVAWEIQKYIPYGKRLVYLGTLNSIPLSLAHREGYVLGASPIDVDSNADAVVSMKQFGAEYAVAGYNNTDLHQIELDKLGRLSTVIVKNKWVTIYKFKK